MWKILATAWQNYSTPRADRPGCETVLISRQNGTDGSLLAQWALIGYTFLTNPIYGAVTLVTYFISLAATAYSYRKIGHGQAG